MKIGIVGSGFVGSTGALKKTAEIVQHAIEEVMQNQ
jgi:hypothetical protein